MIDIDKLFDDLEDRKTRFEKISSNVEVLRKTVDVLEQCEMNMKKCCESLGKKYHGNENNFMKKEKTQIEPRYR